MNDKLEHYAQTEQEQCFATIQKNSMAHEDKAQENQCPNLQLF